MNLNTQFTGYNKKELIQTKTTFMRVAKAYLWSICISYNDWIYQPLILFRALDTDNTEKNSV